MTYLSINLGYDYITFTQYLTSGKNGRFRHKLIGGGKCSHKRHVCKQYCAPPPPLRNDITTVEQSAFACAAFRSQALILSTQVSPARPPFLSTLQDGQAGIGQNLELATDILVMLKQFACC